MVRYPLEKSLLNKSSYQNRWKVRFLTGLLLLTVFFPICTYASEVNSQDSVSIQLDEIIIEASSVVRKVDRDVYYVNENLQQKSADALSLIKNLMIPQLNTNEVLGTISSGLGPVGVRINGRESSLDQLKSINPRYIRKIEWISNPGLQYGTSVGCILNVITINPDRGGAFNVSVMEGLTYFFNNSNFNLTLNHGRSQWNIGASGSFRGHLETYREYNDSYKLSNGEIIERTQQPLPGFFTRNNTYPYLNYNFQKPDTTTLYIGLSFAGGYNQTTEYNGIIKETLLSRSENEYFLLERDHADIFSPTLNLFWEKRMPHNQTFLINGFFGFSNSNSQHTYNLSSSPLEMPLIDINNKIKTKGYFYSLDCNYKKSFKNGQEISSGIKYEGSDYNSTYLNLGGEKTGQILHKIFGYAEYKTKIKNIAMDLGIGATWTATRTADQTQNTLGFTPRFSLSWTPGTRSKWNLTYSSQMTPPTLEQTSSVTQSIDGIQYEVGNPMLKSFLVHRFRFRYGYSNARNFQLSFLGGLNHIPKPIQPFYTWHLDDIIRSYSNSGYCNAVMVSLSLNWEVIRSWLTVSGNLDYNYTWNKGDGFKHKVSGFGQTANISLYHWNFSLNFQFENPGQSLWGQTITRGDNNNNISLGYNFKNWNFSFTVFMVAGRFSQKTELISELVKQKTIVRSKSLEHLQVLTVSYNVEWGRQKQRYNPQIKNNPEIQTIKAAGSR